jgi:hypothetical protein
MKNPQPREARRGRGRAYTAAMNPEVWAVLPSANPAKAAATAKAWAARGYRTAFLLNGPAVDAPLEADLVVRDATYPGWGNSINRLARLVDAPIVVGIGDDMLPDATLTAGEIAAQFIDRFPDTFGVMQPTGDRWGDGPKGALSDRICGSPWLGRAFIERWNGGLGAFWPEYFHFYCDEELHDVTLAAGLLWQRRDLTHHHDHWMRPGGTGKRPAYMTTAHQRWEADKRLFESRKASGFPGHQAKIAGGVEV